MQLKEISIIMLHIADRGGNVARGMRTARASERGYLLTGITNSSTTFAIYQSTFLHL